MIHQNTVKSTQVFGVDLAGKGCLLTPVPNTTLADLYSYSIPPLASLPSSDNDLSSFYDLLSSATKGNFNDSFHDKALSQAASELGKLVTAHISHIKGKVVPLVESFKAQYIDYLSKNSVKNPAEDFEVRMYETPNLLTNEFFLRNITDRNGKDPITKTSDRYNLPTASTVEDIKCILNLGSPKLDNDIAQWMSLVGAEWIVSTYNEFLGQNATGYIESVVTYNDYQIVNHGLLFMMVGLCHKEKGEKFTWLIEFGKDLIFRALRRIESSRKSKRMIVGMDSLKKQISVDKNVYEEWISSGGSPEVVLGILVSPSSDRAFLVSSISEKSKFFLEAWYNYCSYTRSSENIARDRNIREYLKLKSYEMVEEIVSTESHSDYKSSVYKNFSYRLCLDEINAFKFKDLNSAFEVACTLVAKCGYHKTCAYEFISDMETAALENTEIGKNNDSRQAATVAAVKYLCDYMVSQMNIVKSKV